MDNEEFDDEEEPILAVDDNMVNMGSFHDSNDESTARIPCWSCTEEMKSYPTAIRMRCRVEYAEEPLKELRSACGSFSDCGHGRNGSPVSPVVEQADHSRQVIVLPDVTPARSASR